MAKRLKKLKKELTKNPLNFTPQRQIDSGRMKTVDNHRPPTTFVEFFYRMCDGDFPDNPDGYSSPPSQSDYSLAFFFYHKKEGAAKFDDEYQKAWVRRAEVAYPSIVRDMQFVYLLADYNDTHQEFDSVRYDPERDIKEGVDAIVEAYGETYFINLYVDTKKSQKFLNKKKSGRHPSNDAIELHLPISRNDSRNDIVYSSNNNDVWLYSEEHVEDLIKAMKEYTDE